MNTQAPLTCESLDAAPYQFRVEIAEFQEERRTMLTISVATALNTIAYCIEKNFEQYLLLLKDLTRDFGVRLPLMYAPTAEATFKADFKELLTESIHPDIIYGYGDPAVLRVEDYYYAVSTSNDAKNSFPIIRSNDLKNWELAGFVFSEGCKPAWAEERSF